MTLSDGCERRVNVCCCVVSCKTTMSTCPTSKALSGRGDQRSTNRMKKSIITFYLVEKSVYNRNWKNQVFNLFLPPEYCEHQSCVSENKANNKQKQFQALIIDLIQLSSQRSRPEQTWISLLFSTSSSSCMHDSMGNKFNKLEDFSKIIRVCLLLAYAIILLIIKFQWV